jgi:hypothetical protein
LGGQFFNYESKSAAEVFSFMMDMHKQLYGEFETEEARRTFSDIFLGSFLNQLIGSTRKVVDLSINFSNRITDRVLDKFWIISRLGGNPETKKRFSKLITDDKELVDNTYEEGFSFNKIPMEAIFHLRYGASRHEGREETNREAELYHQTIEDRFFQRQTDDHVERVSNRASRARNRNITRNLYNLQRLMPTERLNADDNLDHRQNDVRYSIRSRYIL